jgi:hypothetical protein
MTYPETAKLVILIGIAIFLIAGCNPPLSTPPTWPAQPEPNFGVCSTDRLDTFKGEFTQDRVVESSITIPLRLSAEQMMTIYQKMVEINLTQYPEMFAIPTPPSGEVAMVVPAWHYTLSVENGESKKMIRWTDEIVQPTTPEADRLRELFQIIVNMVHEHPEFMQLPELNFGCA